MSPLRCIEAATVDDAKEIARLCHQWGYGTDAATVRAQLRELRVPDFSGAYAVFVARSVRALSVLGWVAVSRRIVLAVPASAELTGLVVDDAVRRQGVGRALVKQVEVWALAQGLTSVGLRSNVARLESHPFYEALGYTRAKTQHVYRKPIV